MWQPLEQGEPSPELIELNDLVGDDSPTAVWHNDKYQVIERFNPSTGLTWLSIKRNDRAPIHNWRHLQQIKNEVCGPDREALEVYPAESRLADSANEFHLWVLPEGVTPPLGFSDGLVSSDEQVKRFNDAPHKGRQAPWEPGLTTGRNEATKYISPDQEDTLDGALGKAFGPRGDVPSGDE